MRKLLSLFFLALAGFSPAFAQRELPNINVISHGDTIPVHVSCNSAPLNALVIQAFRSHGRYDVVASGGKFDLRFTLVGPAQVRVDITAKDGSPVASSVATGTSDRNALLRAADFAVERTNGRGLKGFFASKLTFLLETGSHKEVCTSDLFFGEVLQVTHDRAIAINPRWAPDGRRIIYTSFFQTGYPDIFLLDLGTSQRSTFVSFKGTNLGAHFSPDGRHVAMVLTGSGSTEIWKSDSSGHGLTRLTRSDSTKASPCFSPDGSQIVFACDPGPQLYVMSASGGGARRVTNGAISRYCAEPDWSRADPNKIAFTLWSGSGYQIAVLDLATGEAKQVSKAPFDGIEPSWLPDGRHVVFTARTRSLSQIFILDTESGRATKVSPGSLGTVLQANVFPAR